MSITAENLSFAYGRHRVLEQVSFTAENGTLTALLGANGAGKTTLFRCILGLLNKYEGTLTADGDNIRSLSPRELAHRVAYIPQSHSATFDYTVRDMVLMGTNHRLSALASPGETENQLAGRAMEQVGIARLEHKYYTHLSGGEQQLVLVARALAQGSRTLLMDEPTASLDYGNQLLVMEQAKKLAREGYCVMVSTHTPQHALWYAHRVLALHEGRLLAAGEPAEVMTAACIRTLYGIEAGFIPTENGPLLCPVFSKP